MIGAPARSLWRFSTRSPRHSSPARKVSPTSRTTTHPSQLFRENLRERTLPSLGGLAAGAALTLSLAACQNVPTTTGAATSMPAGSATPTGAAPGTATPEPSTVVDPDTNQPDYCKSVKDFKEFTGAAADTFGAGNVKTAYCFAGNFAINKATCAEPHGGQEGARPG